MLFSSCYRLYTAIAWVGAARVVSFWKIPPKHALALYKQKTLRFWGLTAQRSWARIILDRFHDMVLSPGDPTAATREPDLAPHEHRTFFFQDTGVAPLTLLVSAGGVAAFSKRQLLLPGSPCYVSASSPFGGARKEEQKYRQSI